MLVKKNGKLYKETRIIFRPFLKANVSNPCSLCIFKSPLYKLKSGKDGCAIFGLRDLYINVCRGFDTTDYYYIPKYYYIAG